MASPETIAQIVEALRPVIADEMAKAVAANKLDVGKKFKWSDDTAVQTLLEQQRKILAALEDKG